jgi:hypothetical protein
MSNIIDPCFFIFLFFYQRTKKENKQKQKSNPYVHDILVPIHGVK